MFHRNYIPAILDVDDMSTITHRNIRITRRFMAVLNSLSGKLWTQKRGPKVGALLHPLKGPAERAPNISQKGWLKGPRKHTHWDGLEGRTAQTPKFFSTKISHNLSVPLTKHHKQC